MPLHRRIGERMSGSLFSRTLVGANAGEIEAGRRITPDITDRKHAEEALRASEERFRNVADNVPQLIWTNDAAGAANYFNRRWYEYSGLSYEESEGLGWQVMVHADDAPGSVARWNEALEKGEPSIPNTGLRRADGGYRWFLGRNVPLREDGKILSWFGSATDIEEGNRRRPGPAKPRSVSGYWSKGRPITPCSCSILTTRSPSGAAARRRFSAGAKRKRSVKPAT